MIIIAASSSSYKNISLSTPTFLARFLGPTSDIGIVHLGAMPTDTMPTHPRQPIPG